MQRVLVEHDFAVPPERAFDHLAEHEHLAAVFGARVQRVRDGDTERNGAGSTRRLSFGGLLPFEETTTVADRPRRIEYRITKGTPLRRHRGEMLFTPLPDGGTHLRYEIVFGAVVPGLDRVVAAGLGRIIPRGLRRLPL